MTRPAHSCLDRVALVTGGSRGIGFAVARRLVEAGASVAVVARSLPRLEAAVRELEPLKLLSARLHHATAELSDPEQAARAVRDCEARLGPIDILINAAGAAESAPFVKTERALLDRMLSVNLHTTWNTMQLVLPGMVERGFGRIVNVASLAGKVGFRYVAAYCAAKHAVVGLTRAVALEVAKQGVTVNAVCPGYVATDMLEQALDRIAAVTGKGRDDARAAIERETPQRRVFAPDEVAHAVLMLLDPGAGGINGQAIAICGGATFS